jgi:hypothetical protein
MWSALVHVTTRVALDYAGLGEVERSRATDAASSEGKQVCRPSR